MTANGDVTDERRGGRRRRSLVAGLVWVAFASLWRPSSLGPTNPWTAVGLLAVGALYLSAFTFDRVRDARRRVLGSPALWGVLALAALGCSCYWYVLAPDYGLAAAALLFGAVTTVRSLQERPLADNPYAQAVVFVGSAGLFAVGLSVRTLGADPAVLALALVGVTTGLVGMILVARFLWN